MRNTNILILLLVLLLAACDKDTVNTTDDSSLVKVFDFRVTSVDEAADGGYILGTTNSITKLSAEGVVQWNKKYTFFNTDSVIFNYTPYAKVASNSEGGFTCMFYGIYKDNGYHFLVKLDKNGNKVWMKRLSFSYVNGIYADAFSFVETADLSYLITFAYNSSFEQGVRALLKIDKDGKVEWEKPELAYFSFTFGGYGDIRDMILTKNNEIMLAGFYDNLTYTYLAKYDLQGNLISENRYTLGAPYAGSFLPSSPNKVIQTSSNDLLIFGNADRGKGYPKTDYQYTMLKVNSDGDSLTSAILGTTKQDFCWAGIQTSDKGFAMIGTSSPVADFPEKALRSSMYLVKMGPNLNVEKSIVYGDNLETQGLFIKENADRGFTLIGAKFGHENLGKQQTVFIKTKPNFGL